MSTDLGLLELGTTMHSRNVREVILLPITYECRRCGVGGGHGSAPAASRGCMHPQTIRITG